MRPHANHTHWRVSACVGSCTDKIFWLRYMNLYTRKYYLHEYIQLRRSHCNVSDDQRVQLNLFRIVENHQSLIFKFRLLDYFNPETLSLPFSLSVSIYLSLFSETKWKLNTVLVAVLKV